MLNTKKKLGAGLPARALAVAAMATAASAFAGDISGGAYGLSANISGATGMAISGPGGYNARVDSDHYKPESTLPDGQYSYEVYGVVRADLGAPDSMNNGRSEEDVADRRSSGEAVIASGYFRVVDGAVQTPSNAVEE